jgi:hypothetical protein
VSVTREEMEEKMDELARTFALTHDPKAEKKSPLVIYILGVTASG